MEVILLKTVNKLGLANTVVNVKPGYARNYLIPQGLALEASKRNLSMHQSKIANQQEQAAKLLEEAKELATKLSAMTFKVAAKAGTSGKIFGSVTNVQVAQAIQEAAAIEMDRRNIEIVEEVKMLGNYTAKVVLHPEVVATVAFEVFEEA